jgi:hypothetical protein
MNTMEVEVGEREGWMRWVGGAEAYEQRKEGGRGRGS